MPPPPPLQAEVMRALIGVLPPTRRLGHSGGDGPAAGPRPARSSRAAADLPPICLRGQQQLQFLLRMTRTTRLSSERDPGREDANPGILPDVADFAYGEYYMHICIFIIFVHTKHIIHIMTFLFRLQVTMIVCSYSNQQLIMTCLMRTWKKSCLATMNLFSGLIYQVFWLLITSFH